MRIDAWAVRPSDIMRIGPRSSARVVAVAPSTVLADGLAFTVQDENVQRWTVHHREDAKVYVLRREGRRWTEAQRQWAFDNDVAASRPGGGA